MDQKIKDKILSIVSCMETGKPTPVYDMVTILHDGPRGVRQVTLGNGMTQGGGDLKQVIDSYIAKNSTYSAMFIPYEKRISTDYTLADDTHFISLLKAASLNDQLMRDSQDAVFDSQDWVPALAFATQNGFTLPLSILVIYDSYVQSGHIFDFLRAAFPAKVPVKGGNEHDWITQYLHARHDWMANHTNAAIRASVYRVNDYLTMVKNNDWNLDTPLVANDNTIS